MKERRGTDTLMDETDADRRAEMPEDSRKGTGGTGLGTGQVASSVYSGRGNIPTGGDDVFRGGAAPRETDRDS